MSGGNDPTDYKASLNLPQTDFPMRGNLANNEPIFLKRWAEADIYGAIQSLRADAPPFILHDGPPYANGGIHHGHILNKVLKDFVVRYQTMSGRRVPYVPGWECHGLPIEHQVDKELGDKKRQMTQVEIRQACRAYADRHVGLQRDEFQRLGIFGQWDDPYTTMSYAYEARTVRLLGEFFRAGIVYKGLKPVHWSWAAQTALADAEVEYEAHTSPSIYVKFALPDPPALLADAAAGRPVHALIWTTTPWTLPANLAIALHPDFDYALVAVNGEGRHKGGALIIAQGLLKSALAKCKIDEADVEVLATFQGHQLVGRNPDDAPRPLARHPFIDRDSVLLPADYVTLEQGTGCVHTAPGHGQEDFGLGQLFGLDVLTPVDHAGLFTARYAPMEGTHVFRANPAIVAMLDEAGALLSHPGLSVNIERYPHCWRTKTPVIFRATEQWFIGLDLPIKDQDGASTGETLRDRALREIDKVQWVPSWGKDRILGMMEHRPDWCISRQRLWGVPITVMYCDKCETDIVDHRVAFHVSELAEAHGSDVWFDRTPDQLTPEGYTCPGCGASSESFRKEADILDVWFDSGVSWSAVLDRKMNQGQVAQLYLDGSDQHRGWFNSSLLASAGTRNQSPYEVCLTHGFVMDEFGRKYSKSSKNYVPPEKMINVDGAETLRLWVAAVDYRGDITLSPQILTTVKDAYKKVRNTCRFLLSVLGDFNPDTDALPLEQLGALDRWALSRTNTLVRRALQAYAQYEFHTIYHDLVRFSTVDLSNTYLNVLKDSLYADRTDAPSRRASQTALYEILSALVRIIAPVLVFTAEEIWDHMRHRQGDPASVHLTDMPQPVEAWDDEALEDEFKTLLAVRAEFLRHLEPLKASRGGERQDGQISTSEEADVVLTAGPDLHGLLSRHEGSLSELFITASVRLEQGQPPSSTLGGQQAANVGVKITPTSAPRCPRCRRFGHGVGERHPELCVRCAGAI